jgi:hypothetical protein
MVDSHTGACPARSETNLGSKIAPSRTLCWTRIEQAVQALKPFVDINAAKTAGFDVSRSFGFEPFTPTLPNALGAFISFKGC